MIAASLGEPAQGLRATSVLTTDSEPASFGGVAWAQQRGGLLSKPELGRMLLDGVTLQVRVWLDDLQRALGRLPVKPPFDLDRIAIARTDVAQAATALCTEVSDPSLIQHCMRTYFWGSILGHQSRLEFDAELFYVACVLHDLGLTPHAPSSKRVPCFAVAAARAAELFLASQGWSAARSRKVGDAIAMHINPYVSASAPEAHLLQAGAGVDVIGLHFEEINPSTVAAVVARFPRLSFKRVFEAAWRTEARHRRGTRTHCASRYLMFERRIRVSPFSE